jgi:WD40 repeat protein
MPWHWFDDDDDDDDDDLREKEMIRREEEERYLRKLKIRVWNVPGGVPSMSLSDDLIAVAGDRLELRSLLHGRVLKNMYLPANARFTTLLLLCRDQDHDVVVATTSADCKLSIVERRNWATARTVWRREVRWGAMVELPGSRIAAAEMFRVVVADSRTGAELLAFLGHPVGASALVSAGEGTVLSGSEDGSIFWWSAEDGSQLQERKHQEGVLSLALSPCRSKVAVGTNDRDVQLFHFPEWTRHSIVLRGHGGDCVVHSVAFSPDGRFYASGGSDSRVNLICAETGALLMGLVLHRRCIDTVAFSAGSATLLSSSGDQNIRVLKFFARWEAKVRAFFGSVEAKDAHRDALSGVAKRLKRHFVLDCELIN